MALLLWVALSIPLALAVGWWLGRRAGRATEVQVPAPATVARDDQPRQGDQVGDEIAGNGTTRAQ